MIPKISRGGKAAGLLAYLQGPGKANEHTDPHLVAGHSAVVQESMIGDRLDRQWALSVAHQLDMPRRTFATKVMWADTRKVNARVAAGATTTEARAAEKFDANVWHCSLSLRADEGQLSDEQWGAIATDFMADMGFDDPSDPRPSARWVAVRHGLSADGNDHIHIAASMVREDGTKVPAFTVDDGGRKVGDYKRAQRAANRLEHKYGLTVLSSRELDRGTRGVTPAELQKAKRNGLGEPDRRALERTVRACATASRTEAEFVRRLRAQKVLVRPRYDKGATGAVVGYSVAATPTDADRAVGAAPVWFGGGRLAKDLTLPRLRDEWDTGVAAQEKAAVEWVAARRGAAVTVVDGRERTPIDPALVARAAEDIGNWNTYLASIPVEDTAQWARAAGRTAGVFAAWSQRTEVSPGPLADAAAALSRSAQIPAHRRAPADPDRLHAGGAALIVLQAGLAARGGAAANALLLRQMMRTMEVFADAERAAGHAQRAQELVQVRERELKSLHSRLLADVDAGALRVSTPTRAVAAPGEVGEVDRLARRAAGEDVSDSQTPRLTGTSVHDLPEDERVELLAALDQDRARAVGEDRIRRGLAGDGARSTSPELPEPGREQDGPER